MDEQIEKLIELAKENPTLEIKFMVNYEVCASDECQYWMAKLYPPKKTVYWHRDERVYIGEEEIKDEMDVLECGIPENALSNDWPKYIDTKYEEMLKTGEIKEAIIAYIDV